MASASERWRTSLEDRLSAFGVKVAQKPRSLLAVLVIVQILVVGAWLASGKGVPMETELKNLWVETGGRVEEEMAYVDKYRPKGWDASATLLLFKSKTLEGNVVSEAGLADQLLMAQKLNEITVTFPDPNGGEDLVFSLSGAVDGTPTKYSLCDFIPFPPSIVPESFAPLVPLVTPCNRVTALDCFAEGGFDFSLGPYVPTLQAIDYPLIVDTYGLLGYTNRPGSFEDLPSFVGMTDEQVLDAVKDGCQGYVTSLMEWDVDVIFGGITTDENRSLTSAKALGLVILMGFPNMLVDKLQGTGLTTEDIKKIQGLWNVAAENLVTTMEANGELSATHVSIVAAGSFDRVLEEFSDANVALVLLGYVFMALFVTISQYSSQKAKNTVFVGLFGLVMVFLGNIFGLAILVLAGVKLNAAVLQVLPFLALGLGVDDLFVLLSVFKERLRSHPNEKSVQVVIGQVLRHGGVSVTLTSVCNAAAFGIGSLIPLPAVQVFCIAASLAVVVNFVTLTVSIPSLLAIKFGGSTAKVADGSSVSEPAPGVTGAVIEKKPTPPAKYQKHDANVHENFTKGFLHAVYIPFMKKTPVRLIAIIGFAALTGLTVMLSRNVEDGLQVIDVVPKDSALYAGVQDSSEYFLFQQAQVVTGGIDYGDPAVQQAMVELMADMETELSFVRNAESDWIEVFNLRVSGGNYTHAPGDAFNALIQTFVSPSEITFIDTYSYGMTAFGYSENGSLVYAFMTFEIIGLDTTDKMVEALRKVREYLSSRCGPDKVIKHCFPSGSVFAFWEQYITLGDNFFKAIAFSEVAIFLSCLLLLADPVTAFFVSAMSLAVVVQIYGCMAVIDIKFSAIPAVSLIMSIGIAVEFTAHVCTHFAGADGSRVDRMAEALHHMFVPILEGGFSSFLGFVCLAFSPFAFVKQYYFGIYFLVVCVGLLNGLFFLPAMLSFMGPIQAHHDPSKSNECLEVK